MANIVWPSDPLPTKYPVTQPPKTTMYYSPSRLVPEIFEIINNATTLDERQKIITAYTQSTEFVFCVRKWVLNTFTPYTGVEYITHTLPSGLAPQTIRHNIKRIELLTNESGTDRKTQEKMLSNILHSINNEEIVFLTKLFEDNLEELYPNLTRELFSSTIPQLLIK
jgi:hypothetical protein